MTGAQALNLLMARLGNRTNTTLRANCLLEMNLVQSATLEGGPLLPWFLITTDATLALSVGVRELTLPTNFLRELDEGGRIEIKNSDLEWKTMTKGEYQELLVHWEEETTSELPLDYALLGTQIAVFPLPEVASPIRMRYLGTGATIADDAVETVWLKYAADLVIAETGIIVASKHVREDPQKVKEFRDDRDKAYARLLAANTARAEANLNRRMG